MGHPINSFGYLLDQWPYLREHYGYYAFFLFTDDHPEFRNLFQRRFEMWDRVSAQACTFFAVAPPPPGWEQLAHERDYWRHYLAHADQERGYDSDAVRQAARYFGVPDKYLPTIVLFTDLEDYDLLTLRLTELSQEQADTLIHNLFILLNNPTVRRYRSLWRLQSLIDRLPLQRRIDAEWCNEFVRSCWEREKQRPPAQIRNIPIEPHRITYRINGPQPIAATLRGMQEELERFREQMQFMRVENREGFHEVNRRLERIEVVLQETIQRIEDYRRPFLVRVATADVPPGQQRDEVLWDLHQEFDAFLQQQCVYLAERVEQAARIELPPELSNVKDDLEEESRAVIAASEILWRHLQTITHSVPIDYAVCGIGLWKALEIELNRCFVDALRVYNHVCTAGTPSTRQRVRPLGKIIEPGRHKGQLSEERINLCEENNPERLRGIELGHVASLLAGSDSNSLSRLIAPLKLPLEPCDASWQDMAAHLAVKVHEVRSVYRNGYAHLQRMDEKAYQGLRQVMLDCAVPHSPLFATVACKVEMLRAGLV